MQLGGKTVFPITLGNGPPPAGICPDNGLRGGRRLPGPV